MNTILNSSKEIFEDIVAIRRDIHSHPELSTKETRTSALIVEELKKYGVDEILNPSDTSIVATIKGSKGPGKCIGIRCDMDALPVQEATGLPFSSENPGVMHACGHDMHVAMMLGNARLLCGMRDKFAGQVKLIFEASEEHQPGGAKGIIKSGAVDDVDAFLGMHVFPTDGEVGKIALRTGPVTTSADEVFINVHGKGGHGSQPHKANDAVLAAAQITVLLQQIQARNVDPLDTCIFTVNYFHGGVASNIIADECELKGAMRAYTPETREIATQKIYDVCKGVEHMSGCTVDAKVVPGYDACSNDGELVGLLSSAFDESLGNDGYFMMKDPMGFSEDYSFFATLTGKPSVLMFLNAGHAPGMSKSTLHSCDCTFDEDAMIYGMTAMTSGVISYLK